MTDLLSPEDTGEITRVDVGETTTDLASVYLNLPSVRLADVTGEMPLYVPGVEVGFAPTQPRPPRPLSSPNGPPKPAADLAAAQPFAPLERVVDWTAAETPPPAPLPPLRPSVPRPRPSSWRQEEPTLRERLTHKPKHRAARIPSPLRGLAQLTVAVVALTALLWLVIS